MKNKMKKSVLLGVFLSVSVLSMANAASLPPPPPVGQVHFGLMNNSGSSINYSLDKENCGSNSGSLQPYAGQHFYCSNYYHNIQFKMSNNGAELCSGEASSGHMNIEYIAKGWMCSVVQLAGSSYASLSPKQSMK